MSSYRFHSNYDFNDKKGVERKFSPQESTGVHFVVVPPYVVLSMIDMKRK